jgi:Asp-tRNA(Asn)/Glu-tRNA(Gln) amidotransferase B subunit
MPGMLPVPNRECIRQAVRTGMALDAKINKWSRFDRKNYFYADLPQGYQISQLYHPLVGEGEVEVLVDEKDESTAKRIGIERIHVEQDAGKLMHDQHATMSYVDLNRAGVALMEIVSRPDMRSPAEAGAYLRKLRAILRYVGSCDGNMEEGSMRADVNVSVRKPGGELGTRTETKNVNSVRFVMAAIEHDLEDLLGERSGQSPVGNQLQQLAGLVRADRALVDGHAETVERPEVFGRGPVGCSLGVSAAFEEGIKPARNVDVCGQYAGVVRRDSEPFVALALRVRQLR